MSSSPTSSDSNVYIATADSKDYLINPIDWNNITTHGVKDNSIPGSKIISIPVSKIVGDLPGGTSKADVDAANLSTSNIASWQQKLQIDTLDALVNTKQDKQDNSLQTASKTVVGAINENFDKVQNINNVTSGFTGFNGIINTEFIMTNTIMPYKIASDGSIPIQIETVQSTGNINHNGNICFGNKYYEPLDSENEFKVNTNGALGWYVWRRVFIDENNNEILPDSNITITNVKLKYATGNTLTSNNISIKYSDWQYFKNAFHNRSVVMHAVKTTENNRSNYTISYFQLSNILKVFKIDDGAYRVNYNDQEYNITPINFYAYKATSITNPNNTYNCIADVSSTDDLDLLLDNTKAQFAIILENPDSIAADGTYTVTFSLPTSDDNFGQGIVNIFSNNNKVISDSVFVPTLRWNADPTVANINECKLYLSNKQATIEEFTSNTLPAPNLPNLFENLDNYTGVLGDFSYTQKSHYTSSLIHESHEYKDGYNTMTLRYEKPGFGDATNTNIVKMFDGEYGDKNSNTRSWDTSLRVTTNPELGCVQIFNFSYAEGFNNVAAGAAAHVEGKGCKTYEDYSHVEGSNNVNIGYGAHVEGWDNTNFGYTSHVEGYLNLCTVNYGHVEGVNNKVQGHGSHAEGYTNICTANYTHAEGMYNTAKGYSSHAEGYQTIASGEYQHVGGKWNIEDTENKYAFIIGNGTANGNRSNAFTVDWNANLTINGNATFPYDKKINFYTEASAVTATYGMYINISNDGGGSASISSSQIKLNDTSTSSVTTTTPGSLLVQDGNGNKTTITADKIIIGENNWSTELGYGKLLIAGDGIQDQLSYGPISSDTFTHAIKLPKGNTEDQTSFQIWVGTQAEYTALTSKNPSTMYFIVATDGTVSIKFGV